MYRFGQKKTSYIYRFVSLGTMEENIYDRQINKLAMSKRVIDDFQIDRHYNESDLTKLYKMDIEPKAPLPMQSLPDGEDEVFANQLLKSENRIYKFHKHDSLLENKSGETLSLREIKEAWREYEVEDSLPTVSQKKSIRLYAN